MLEEGSTPDGTGISMGNVRGNSAQAEIEEVRVIFISATIELNNMIHFSILVVAISSGYSRKLNLPDWHALGVWTLE